MDFAENVLKNLNKMAEVKSFEYETSGWKAAAAISFIAVGMLLSTILYNHKFSFLFIVMVIFLILGFYSLMEIKNGNR